MRPRISIRGSVRPYVRPYVSMSVCPYVRQQLCKTAENRSKWPKNIVVAYRSTMDASICPLGLVYSLHTYWLIGLLIGSLVKRRHSNSLNAAVFKWQTSTIFLNLLWSNTSETFLVCLTNERSVIEGQTAKPNQKPKRNCHKKYGRTFLLIQLLSRL